MENYWFSIMCTMSNNVYPLLIKISLFQPTVCQTSFFLSRFKHLTDSVQYSSLPLLFIYNTCFYIFKQRNNFLHRNLWCINPFFFFWSKKQSKWLWKWNCALQIDGVYFLERVWLIYCYLSHTNCNTISFFTFD